MGEQDHGLHVEPVPKLPGAEKLPPTSAATLAITESLPGLTPEAQRSVLAIMEAAGRTALAPMEAPDDTEADRSGAS